MTTQARIQALADAAMHGSQELRFAASLIRNRRKGKKLMTQQAEQANRLESRADAIDSALLAIAGGSRRSDRDVAVEKHIGSLLLMACRVTPKTREQLIYEVVRAQPGATEEQANRAFDQVAKEGLIFAPNNEKPRKWRVI